MPLFDFKCIKCNEVVELNKKINEPDPLKCPKCGKNALERTWTKAPGVEYKGKGWFKTTGSY